MTEQTTDPSSDWYQDPGVLLGELQRGRVTSSGLPVIPGYDDFHEIRRGGQGEVYSAYHGAMKRRVAIKVLRDRAYGTEASSRRFEREIDLVADLQHPNIVRVYDRGVTDRGQQYFSMEYIDGRPLDEYVAERVGEGDGRGFDLRERLGLFSKICAAVGFAHRHGVVHRDLKPANILVDADGEPRVVDFGLAKGLGDAAHDEAGGLTLTGEFMGTLAYASPEQVAGDPSGIDTRTDVYGLGMVLYEMLTGCRPFSTDVAMADLIEAITRRDPPRPGVCAASASESGAGRWRAAGRIDDEIDTIVLKALAKDPDRRYQSVAALREDVRRYLAGEPVDAKRDSSWYLLGKMARRHKAPAGVAAAFVVLVAAFGATASVLYQRAADEAVRANEERDKANEIRVFLEDTLGSVGPPPSNGRQTTVAEMLDEAVHWVGIVGGRAEISAALQNTIGNSYRSLGQLDKAERQLLEALERRRRIYGERHLEVARSLNSLGLLRRDQGDPAEAERLFTTALDMRLELLGEDHLAVAMSHQNLGALALRQEDLKAAEMSFTRALDIRRAVLGEDHPDVAMCLFQLGTVAERRGDPAEAERRHRSALRIRRATQHGEHPDIARSLKALGRVLIKAGDPEGAEPLLREAVEIVERIVPEDHWRLAEVRSELGECLSAARRYEDAEPLLLSSLRTLETARGPRDPVTEAARRRVVRLYRASGRPESAAQLGADPAGRRETKTPRD